MGNRDVSIVFKASDKLSDSLRQMRKGVKSLETDVEHYKKLDMSENVKAWAISTAINLWKNKKRKYAWRKRIAKQESYEVHMENEFQSSACCCSLGCILYNPARADV